MIGSRSALPLAESPRMNLLSARPWSAPALVALAATLVALAACGDDGGIAAVDRAEIVVPSDVIFDEARIGEVREQTFTVENAGDAPLVIRSYSWSGNASDFSVQGLDDLRVDPNDFSIVTVTYTPSDDETDEAVLTIESNAANRPEADIRVSTQATSSRIFSNPSEVLINSEGTGTETVMPVEIINIGSEPFSMTSMRLIANTGDFELRYDAAALPAELGPDDIFTVEVAYTPSTGGSDFDQLLVECDAENCVDGRYLIPINGIAETPRLRLTPGDVAFGPVALEADPPPTREIIARNEGQGLLVIQSISWAFNPEDGDDEFQVVSVGGEPFDPAGDTTWELAAGEETSIIVSYRPTDAEPDVEQLVFRSNDEGLPQQTVRVGGTLSAPRIEVFPRELEFPLTAIGLNVEREVVVRNVGAEPLTLDPLRTLGGGFSDGAFTVLNADGLPDTLGAGEEYTLRVEYRPIIADISYAGTIYVLPTNDPLTAEVRIDVTGTSAAEPECDLRPLPGTINFGTVPRGTLAEQTGRVRNNGTGPCEVRRVTKQSSLFGFLFSDYFELVSVDPPPPFELLPGDEFTITASYFPVEVTDLAETFGDGGSVEIDVVDPYDRGRTVTCGVVPPLFTGVARDCGVNLQARSAVAEIAVIPGDLDFGMVTLGCNSQTQTVRVYNTGGADVDISSIGFEGCSGEFTMAGLPVLPLTLSRGDSFAFQARYRPDDEGVDTCNIVLESTSEGSGRLVVPVRGEGVTFTRTVDRFEQVSGREVDVLFVVDNSGSMGEEQSNLSRNFSSFISAAAAWDTDYQIGIVTTQTEGDVPNPGGGDLAPGELLGSLNNRIITPANSGAFATNVRVGTADTTASASERGLEAARLALTDPVITDLGAACSDDSECGSAYRCIQGTAGTPRACGGYNRTFLREDASLEIVFVSDEEDQSRAELSFFIDFFKSIKGFRNESLFHASAIVGPSGGCSSSNGEADAGNRYIEVARETGGEVGSICDSDFASSLRNIGDRAFGLRVQFFLSRAADPATVSVYDIACDGSGRTPRGSGWTFDVESNAIIFDDASAPSPGDCFEVEYDAACF